MSKLHGGPGSTHGSIPRSETETPELQVLTTRCRVLIMDTYLAWNVRIYPRTLELYTKVMGSFLVRGKEWYDPVDLQVSDLHDLLILLNYRVSQIQRIIHQGPPVINCVQLSPLECSRRFPEPNCSRCDILRSSACAKDVSSLWESHLTPVARSQHRTSDMEQHATSWISTQGAAMKFDIWNSRIFSTFSYWDGYMKIPRYDTILCAWATIDMTGFRVKWLIFHSASDGVDVVIHQKGSKLTYSHHSFDIVSWHFPMRVPSFSYLSSRKITPKLGFAGWIPWTLDVQLGNQHLKQTRLLVGDGWWFQLSTPLKNIMCIYIYMYVYIYIYIYIVSWDYYSQDMEKYNMFQTTNQQEKMACRFHQTVLPLDFAGSNFALRRWSSFQAQPESTLAYLKEGQHGMTCGALSNQPAGQALKSSSRNQEWSAGLG